MFETLGRSFDGDGWLGGDKILQVTVNLTRKECIINAMNVARDDTNEKELIQQLYKVIDIVVANNAVDEFAEVEIDE